MEKTGTKQTFFDTLVTNRQLQLVKAVLPYIGYDSAKSIALLVQMQELKNAMNLTSKSFKSISGDKDLSVAGTDKPFDFNEFFNTIKDYLTEEQSEMIESMLGMMDLFTMDEDAMGEMFGGYMDMFKEMF